MGIATQTTRGVVRGSFGMVVLWVVRVGTVVRGERKQVGQKRAEMEEEESDSDSGEMRKRTWVWWRERGVRETGS